MTDAVQIALVATIVPVVTVVGGILLARMNAIKKTGEEVHILVNSRMGVMLKKNAVNLRRMARLTGDAGDIAEAGLADKELAEHEKQQDDVDRLANR